MTFQIWKVAQSEVRQELQAAFDFRVREVTSRIKHRMKAYEQALHGVQGLFVADKIVDRNKFGSFVSTLKVQENYPGIQGIRFSPIITKAEKGSY